MSDSISIELQTSKLYS